MEEQAEHSKQTGPTNTYIIDSDKTAEMSRLQLQGRTITSAMDGLLPSDIDPNKLQHVLDVACGPGDWALDLAYAYPHIEVTGIDVSQQMIQYASSRRTPNAQFLTMNILQPLDFPDNSFDFLNLRLLQGVLHKNAWPGVLCECYRLLKPGGYIRLTESEMAISNSLAGERYTSLLVQAMHRSGHSFSPDGRHFGTVPMLGKLLSDAGFEKLNQKAFCVDGSYGARAHQAMYENGRMGLLLIQPFIIKMGLSNEEEMMQLYRDIAVEMHRPDFRSIWFFLSVWGNKPEAAS